LASFGLRVVEVTAEDAERASALWRRVLAFPWRTASAWRWASGWQRRP
jgi:hypothetical protein